MSGTKVETINGRTYSFGTLPATEAVAVLVTIGTIIGEPLVKAVSTYKPTEKGQPAAMESAVIGLMMTRLSEIGSDKLLRTMETCFKYVRIDNGSGTAIPINIDRDFTGHPKELWQVFIKALQVNFSSFTEGLNFGFPHAQA